MTPGPGAPRGFLTGLMGAIGPKLDRAHDEEQASIKEQRANLWSEIQSVLADSHLAPEKQSYKGNHGKIIHDKYAALQKLLSPETKKRSSPLGQLFEKLVPARPKGGGPQDQQGGATQPQGAAPAAQPGTGPPQPNQLQAPASQAQVARPAPGAAPAAQPPAEPQGNRKLQAPAAQAQVGKAQPAPVQPQPPDSWAEMFSPEEQTQRQQEARAVEDKRKLDFDSKLSDQEFQAKLKRVNDNPDMGDDEKKEARLSLFGIKPSVPPSLQRVHVLTDDGWKPAEYNPKTGAYEGEDHAPIPPAKIKDVTTGEPPKPPEAKSKSEEELTDESLHGATPEIRRSAKETLDAMQRRKVDIAKAGKQTPEKSQEDKAIEEAGQSLAKGDLSRIQDITSMRSENRLRVYTRAKEINPQYSTFGTQQQINMEILYTTGKMGDNLQSFGTFLEHAGEVSDVINNIRLSGNPAINKPLNWWRKNMEGDPDYQALLTALEPVRKEYESFLLGNHAMYADDRQAIQTILSDNASPAQYQGALKQMGKTAKARYTEANQRYRRVRHKDLDDPFSDEAREGARKVGVDLSIGPAKLNAPAGAPPASGGAAVPKNGDKQTYNKASYTFDGTQWVKDKK